MLKKTLITLILVSMLGISGRWGGGNQEVQAQAPDIVIYDDALVDGWFNTGTAVYNLEWTDPVYSGSKSIRLTMSNRQYFQLKHGGLYTHGYTHLYFWIHGGGSTGQDPKIYAIDGDNRSGDRVLLSSYATIQADEWVQVQIPLVDIEVEESVVTGFGWQEANNQPMPTFYMDEVTLVSIQPAGTPEVLDWEVHPWAVPSDGQTQTVITAALSDSEGDIDRVSVDLTAFGGSSQALLYDDGKHNDGAPGDGTFGLITTVAPSASHGETPLFLTVTDLGGHQNSRFLGTFLILTPLTASWPEELVPFLGWGNLETNWQQTIDLPWNYQNRFLNPGWQDRNPNFVRNVVQDAWARDEVPVFTIELFLGGQGTCGGLGESDCMFFHLQDPVFVEEMFNDELIPAAQQASGSHPVIFHIEPDGSASMHRYTLEHDGEIPEGSENPIEGDEPDTLPTQSGEGYPDTYTGLVHRMIDVIHQAAPNVLVSLQARTWATGSDVAGSDSPTYPVDSIAQRTAYFLTTAGGPGLDLIFVDWRNFDAGAPKGIWWDQDNIYMPNFNRILHWENRVAYYSGLPLVLFRMPVGNMNLPNVCDAYQDDRLDYAMDHSRDLINAGIWAVLTGGGDFCRTNPSEDGGYLEAKATVYYAQPATPTGLNVLVPEMLNTVEASWSPNSEFDIWGYRVYYGRSPGQWTGSVDAHRRTTLEFSLPAGGEWYLAVVAYDTRGVESEKSPPFMISFDGVSRIYLPLVVR